MINRMHRIFGGPSMRNTTDVVALSDEQLEIIMTAARRSNRRTAARSWRPSPASWRPSRASSVARIVRAVQRDHYDAPDLSHAYSSIADPLLPCILDRHAADPSPDPHLRRS